MRTLLIVLGLALTASWWPRHAHARFGAKLDLETFRDRCMANELESPRFLETPPKIGVVEYFSTGVVVAGQTRFSFRHLRKTMRAAIKGNRAKHKPPGAYYDRKLEAWVFAHDNGRAVFSTKDYATAIHYRKKLYMRDGTHKWLISKFLKARVPIYVVEDWSHLSQNDFNARMADDTERHAYWLDFEGTRVAPVDVSSMENDPNLLLARFVTAKVDASYDATGGVRCENRRGANHAIALKVNNDIRYLELEMADAWSRNGVVFDESRRESDISTSERRALLKILKRERKMPGSRLDKILLLDEPRSSAKLNMPLLIEEHVTRLNCPELLNRPAGASDD